MPPFGKMMSARLVLVLSCFGALFLTCYGPVLFMDRQFGFRDAGHYYYPLNKRVQAEWRQGTVAALGTGRERGNAVAGQPDRCGPLSG